MKRIILSIVCGAAVIARAETRVGIIGLDTSHAIAFTKIMNVTKDPAVAGFRVTHAYQWGSKDIASSTNRYPKYFSASALRYGKAVQAARAGDLDTAQPIDASLKSNLLTELGNVSLQIGEAVHIDPETGKLKDPNGPAAKLWMPQYEPGWELKA